MEQPLIVVGVDGSEPSKAALRWALDEARLRGASIRVVHAWWAYPALVPGAPIIEEPGPALPVSAPHPSAQSATPIDSERAQTKEKRPVHWPHASRPPDMRRIFMAVLLPAVPRSGRARRLRAHTRGIDDVAPSHKSPSMRGMRIVPRRLTHLDTRTRR